MGWCEAEFNPVFKEEVLEDRGEHEVVRDFAGRHVLYFKNRRSEFMPEFLDHPVKDMIVSQGLIGGYMCLRSLIGPEGLLYMFMMIQSFYMNSCSPTIISLSPMQRRVCLIKSESFTYRLIQMAMQSM